ncbi:MAG: hypothetical protein IJ499_06545 [Clostridia bacterium]|nr:hypothetical protein [Clostridia bacterium]
MDKDRILRLVLGLFSGVTVFLLTGSLVNLALSGSIGATAYAISMPLMLPLRLLASLLCFSLFFAKKHDDEAYEEAEEEEAEIEGEASYQSNYTTEFDTDIYPEFQKKDTAIKYEETPPTVSRPDIRKILGEQKGEAVFEEKESEAPPSDWVTELYGKSDDNTASADLFDELPAELPEEYEYFEEEDTEEEYDGEYYRREVHPLAIRLPLAFIAFVLAIFIPLNTATVYTADAIVQKRIFKTDRYELSEATHYTVGVKLNGDVSLKAHFPDSKEFELNYGQSFSENDKFSEMFSSPYGYAAFCKRLLNENGVTKNTEDLRSLEIPASLSDKDIEYIYEITEGAN